MRECWDIKGCPGSHYSQCAAYKAQMSCWVERNGCMCREFQECQGCPLFKQHSAELDSEG